MLMDAAAAREPFDRWFWWWWAGSVALVYALQGIPPLVLDFPGLSVWTSPEWLAAIAAYAVTLAALTVVLRRRLQHPLSAVLWAAAAATFVYLVVPSVVIAITVGSSAEQLVTGWMFFLWIGVDLAGNGWVAFLVPVLAAIPLRGRKPVGRYPAKAGH
jgi:hypothetical protein